MSDDLMLAVGVKRIKEEKDDECQTSGSQSNIDYDKTEKKVKYIYFVIIIDQY